MLLNYLLTALICPQSFLYFYSPWIKKGRKKDTSTIAMVRTLLHTQSFPSFILCEQTKEVKILLKNSLSAPVKVSIRIHNMNTDRLKFDWVLHMWPVNVFLCLGSGPGSLQPETWSKGLTPPMCNGVSFGSGLGKAYTQCVQDDLPLASKTRGVDDALYFHFEQRTHVGVPRKNLSTEQRNNPALQD